MSNVKRGACILIVLGLVIVTSIPSLGAPATVKKTIQALDNGNFMIKLVVTSTSSGIFAFELKDPKGSIIDVYAPREWCILSDGEVCMSRTSGAPIQAGKSLEFVIYSTAGEAQYVWTFFGPIEQVGKSEVL